MKRGKGRETRLVRVLRLLHDPCSVRYTPEAGGTGESGNRESAGVSIVVSWDFEDVLFFHPHRDPEKLVCVLWKLCEVYVLIVFLPKGPKRWL